MRIVPYRVRSNRGCNHLNTEECGVCAEDARRPIGAPRVHTFHEGVYEHMQGPLEKPVEVTSPDQLRREARARGLQSQWLDDGMSTWRNRSSNKWI